MAVHDDVDMGCAHVGFDEMPLSDLAVLANDFVNNCPTLA